MGLRSLWGDDKNVLKLEVVLVAQLYEYEKPLNCTLLNGYNSQFYVVLFYHKKTLKKRGTCDRFQNTLIHVSEGFGSFAGWKVRRQDGERGGTAGVLMTMAYFKEPGCDTLSCLPRGKKPNPCR